MSRRQTKQKGPLAPPESDNASVLSHPPSQPQQPQQLHSKQQLSNITTAATKEVAKTNNPFVHGMAMIYDSTQFSPEKLDAFVRRYCKSDVIFTDPILITRGKEDYRTQMLYLHQFFCESVPLEFHVYEADDRIVIHQQVKYVLQPLSFLPLTIPVYVDMATILHLETVGAGEQPQGRAQQQQQQQQQVLRSTDDDDAGDNSNAVQFGVNANANNDRYASKRIVLHEDIWNPLASTPIVSQFYRAGKWAFGACSSRFFRWFLIRKQRV